MQTQLTNLQNSLSDLDFSKNAEAITKWASNLDIPVGAKKILSNASMLKTTQQFLSISPETFCDAYNNYANGIDQSVWISIEKGASTTFTVLMAISHASLVGAGPLAGYAGLASVVSQLGLSGIVTTIAGLLGSSTTGAAATAVITSAVGGPVMMAIIIGGGLVAFHVGTHKATNFALDQVNQHAGSLNQYAQQYCQTIAK